MDLQAQRPDAEQVIAPLKNFQRRTVDYVFRRLYLDKDHVDRFLIADEAGLGKTLVARGVLARAVNHLWNDVRRIDVVYVCANRDIAAQNISRLNITGERDVAVATRMTLLPMYARNLQGRKLNFVSFTPHTSFDLRSQGGIAYERAMIYHILRLKWGWGDRAGPRNLLQCNVRRDRWLQTLEGFPTKEIDPGLAEQYLELLDSQYSEVRQDFGQSEMAFGRHQQHVPMEDHRKRMALIGRLRAILAESCLNALEPDIVILDEFQRFKYLLQEDSELAFLAQALFQYDKVKVLLLSATPYKMYTMYHEREQEDHWQDFLNTSRFLLQANDSVGALKESLDRYRTHLLTLGAREDGLEALRSARSDVQRQLRKVMVRTERLSVTQQHDAMVERREEPLHLTAADLDAFSGLDRVAKALSVQDTVEYWKSTPYALNLMDRYGYKIKEELVRAVAGGEKAGDLKAALEAGNGLLSWSEVQAYQQLDPANARLRVLLERFSATAAWRLLWIPPSLPYYQATSGPYSELSAAGMTKALVFSSWRVVPKAIAMLTSYEAERHMVSAFDSSADYETERRRRRPLLRFALSRLSIGSSRLTGMSNFNLLYPCWTLASRFDPLYVCSGLADSSFLPDLPRLMEKVTAEVRKLLQPVLQRHQARTSRTDERWYWAGAALLDREHARQEAESWRERRGGGAWRDMLQTDRDDPDDSNFAAHIDSFWEYFSGQEELGRPPDDLAEMLAKVALASPAVVSLRSLMRLMPESERSRNAAALLAGAASVGLGFRSLFNMPENIALVRSIWAGDDARYWESILDYCASGNLQSVMDEYVHVLRDALGLFRAPCDVMVEQVAEEIRNALSIRTASLTLDEIHLRGQHGVELTEHRLRCMFALAFQDSEDELGGKTRSDQVRSAFNSPFRPFVLATTSVGQEGLDFHQYCHSVYHWNLPSNPVDLEQREGRVHRYKCHAVRRNLADELSLTALRGRLNELDDPWRLLFSLACERRELGQSDLIPFWVYEVPGGHKVERHIMALPLSREHERLPHLLKGLAAYRLVFGQARQEDLVRFLERFGSDVCEDHLRECRIDLSPP